MLSHSWWFCFLFLTLKMPRKTTSENAICLCRLLCLLANFSNILFAYKQTVWTQFRLLAVWSGSTLFATMTLKVSGRRQSRWQLLCLASKGLIARRWFGHETENGPFSLFQNVGGWLVVLSCSYLWFSFAPFSDILLFGCHSVVITCTSMLNCTV